MFIVFFGVIIVIYCNHNPNPFNSKAITDPIPAIPNQPKKSRRFIQGGEPIQLGPQPIELSRFEIGEICVALGIQTPETNVTRKHKKTHGYP
jgi:hypothetical protein